MYAPVAVMEPAVVELSVLPLATGAAAPVKLMEEQADAEETKPRRRSRGATIALRAAIALVLAALVVALGMAAARFVHSDAFDGFVHWLQHHEVVGSGIYVAGFIFFIVLCFPSTGFELFAGYIFGFWLGLALATAGKLSGSVLSFVIGRYLCRERVRAYMDTRAHPAFRAFQTLLARRQVLVVFLTRTAFFPIAIKNYGLSALGVGFPVYFVAALVTGLPFSVVWVYSGKAAQDLTLLLSGPKSHATTEVVVLLVGVLSALALLGFVGCYTRKYVLAMAEEENAASDAAKLKYATDAPTKDGAVAAAIV